MGKIRVKDLARKMGVENQDLLFKLKAIGVRVEGDDAEIDAEIIKAILTGKRLPQPREVIIRDDSEPSSPSRSVRRPGKPGRAGRRSMIQRVDNEIRDLGPGMRPDGEGGDVAPAAASATPVKVESPQPAEVDAAPAKPPAEAPPQVEQTAPKPSAPAPPAKEEAAPQAKAEAAPPKPAAKPKAPAKAEAKPAAAKPAAKPAEAKPKAEAKEAPKAEATARPGAGNQEQPLRKSRTQIKARLIERGTGQAPPILDQRSPSSPSQPSRGRGRRGRPGHGGGMGGGRGRSGPRIPSGPPAEIIQPSTSSERGRRRAKKREEDPRSKTSTGIQFKEDRPEGPVTISEGMTVREFAEKLGVKSKDLIRGLVQRGIMANINHVLDTETATMLAEELGVETMEVSFEEEVQLQHEVENVDVGERIPRAPVVTVMGHVDHGKTTLLDSIRSSTVAEGEAGGITQHIGAYHVDVEDKQVVFLDTPGHEAFTMMRARGAKVTDIVVLVVAADDGVMPQTLEAIDHAKAADVPIIVAINKIDKANANPDRVRKELADRGLVVEDWGGDVVSIPMSALRREGISELLEMILITADLLELKANAEIPAQGVVLEARKEVGRGIVATTLVQEGTLQRGDVFVSGSSWGRVRLLSDDHGAKVQEAGPATPVEVIGFNDLPKAGDLLQVVGDESRARSITELRRQEERQRELAPKPKRMSLEQLFDKMAEEEVAELPVIVKADVHGSVEVLRDALTKQSTDKVAIKILSTGVGAITTNDVIFASASQALIVGFNVRPERNAATMAEKEGVDILLHTVIYELLEEMRNLMAGLLDPIFEEVQNGRAEVRDTFKIPRMGVVAGCMVVDGTIPRSASVRLLRDNVVLYEGKISSLKRFKEDASEVRNGFECGIGLENYQDIKPGDEIEAYSRREVAATL